MKFDVEKMFGHPVLRDTFPEEDVTMLDYPKHSFQPDVYFNRDFTKKDSAKLEYEVANSVPELNELVKAGKAEYRLNLTCGSTFHSENHKISLEGEIELDGAKLRDEIEIMILLVTTDDVSLRVASWNEDYGTEAIPITKDSILAWHSPFIKNVSRDRFYSSRTLIDFIIDESLKDGETSFDGSNDYVQVGVNSQTHRSILQAEQANEVSMRNVTGSIYHGIVMEMLVEMIRMSEDDEDVSNLRWSSIIQDKCRDHSLRWERTEKLSSNAQTLLGGVFNQMMKHSFGGPT